MRLLVASVRLPAMTRLLGPLRSALLGVSQLLALYLMFFSLAAVANVEEHRDQLEQTQDKIQTIEQGIERKRVARDTSIKALRDLDRAISGFYKKIAASEAVLARARAEQPQLAQRAAVLEKNLADQVRALNEQVKLMYRMPRAPAMQVLLDQRTPGADARMAQYYAYIARAQSARISDLRATAQLLQGTRDRQRALIEQTQNTQRALSAQRQRALNARAQRTKLVAQLNRQLKTDAQKLAQARRDAARLARLIADLTRESRVVSPSQYPSFATMRGKLPWPLQGNLQADYNKPRGEGDLRWSGLVIAVDYGTPVRAIHYGRVVFSDWWEGYGQLVIIDHGKDYMSIYAYNRDLYKQKGDLVRPGDRIAAVGDTGELRTSALYFELRHASDPINPHPWINRAISAADLK